MCLNRKKNLFIKRVRETNFCEPNSQFFSINFDFNSSILDDFGFNSLSFKFQVNHGSQIITAPKVYL
jgi:hypothetical protein